MNKYLSICTFACLICLGFSSDEGHGQTIDWAVGNFLSKECPMPDTHLSAAYPLLDTADNMVAIYAGQDSIRLGDSTIHFSGLRRFVIALDSAEKIRWSTDISSLYASPAGSESWPSAFAVDSNGSLRFVMSYTGSSVQYGTYQFTGIANRINFAVVCLKDGMVVDAAKLPGTLLVSVPLIDSTTFYYAPRIEVDRNRNSYVIVRVRDSLRIGSKLFLRPSAMFAVLFSFDSHFSLRGYRYLATQDSASSNPVEYDVTAIRAGGCAFLGEQVDSLCFSNQVGRVTPRNIRCVCRYDSNCSLVWYYSFDSSAAEAYFTSGGITSDGAGNVIANIGDTGDTFDGILVRGDGGSTWVKISPDGHPIWATSVPRLWGLGFSPSFRHYEGQRISKDQHGNMYAWGIAASRYSERHFLHDDQPAVFMVSPDGVDSVLYADKHTVFGSILGRAPNNVFIGSGLGPWAGGFHLQSPYPYRFFFNAHIGSCSPNAIGNVADTVCAGATLTVPLDPCGLYPGDSAFATFASSDSKLYESNRFADYSETNQRVVVPSSLPSGQYHLFLVTDDPLNVRVVDTAIYVHALPSVRILHPKGLRVCDGEEVGLIASGAQHYRWSTGDTARSIYVSKEGTYRLAGIDSNGCSNIDSVNVIVNPLPKVNVTALGNLSFCEGDSVRLQASGARTYLWSNQDTSRIITIRDAGTYSVFGWDSSYCGARSDCLVVSVFENPDKPTISRDGNELVSSSDTNNQWYYNGVKIQAGTRKRFPLSAEGAYSVSVTNEHGCSRLSDPYNYKNSGSGVLEVESGLSVSISERVCLVRTGEPTHLTIEILDVLGRKVALLVNSSSNGSLSLPIPALPAGTYFLRAETPSKTVTMKFIES